MHEALKRLIEARWIEEAQQMEARIIAGTRPKYNEQDK